MVQFFKIYPDTLELGQPSVAPLPAPRLNTPSWPNLHPLLSKGAGGRDISGLSAYE
jgi:hypothetical protein